MNKLILILFLMFISPGYASALSCSAQPPELSYLQYPYVFTGTVTRIEKENDPRNAPFLDALVQVSVEEVHKGELPETVLVEGGYFWAGPFKAGERYLFYVYKIEKGYKSGECGPSVPLSEPSDISIAGTAREHLQRIDKLKAMLGSLEQTRLEGEFVGNIGSLEDRSITFTIEKAPDGSVKYAAYNKRGKLVETQDIKENASVIKRYVNGNVFESKGSFPKEL